MSPQTRRLTALGAGSAQSGRLPLQRALLGEGNAEGKRKGSLSETENSLNKLITNGAGIATYLVSADNAASYQDDFDQIVEFDGRLAEASTNLSKNKWRHKLKSAYDALVQSIKDDVWGDEELDAAYALAASKVTNFRSNKQIDDAMDEAWTAIGGRFTFSNKPERKVAARVKIRELSETRPDPPAARDPNHLRMKDLKSRIVQRLRAWSNNHAGGYGAFYPTGWVHGDSSNPHFITATEFNSLREWWGTGAAAAYGNRFWVSDSVSGGANVKDLHASYTADTTTGTNYVWHIRVKND